MKKIYFIYLLLLPLFAAAQYPFYVSSDFGAITGNDGFSKPKFKIDCGKNFNPTMQVNDDFTSYAWDFGNGQTSNIFKPNLLVNKEGIYDASLTIKRNNSFRVLKSVKITNVSISTIDYILGFPSDYEPDYYLEFYQNNTLNCKSNYYDDQNEPVTFYHSNGILLDRTLTLTLKDYDPTSTDDFMGSVIIPANFVGGVLKDTINRMELEIKTELVNTYTFPFTFEIRMFTVSIKDSCVNNLHKLSTYDSYSKYLWSTGSSNKSILVGTGTYTLTVTNSAGCISEDELVIEENVQPFPEIVCINDSIKCVNCSPHYNHIYFYDNTGKSMGLISESQGHKWKPSKAGIYYATTTINAKCILHSNKIEWPSCKIILNNSDDIENSEYDFNIYPNPSMGSFHITGNILGEDSEIWISNSQGKNVYNTILNTNKADFNLDLPQGTYLVKISNKSKSVVKKLIILN